MRLDHATQQTVDADAALAGMPSSTGVYAMALETARIAAERHARLQARANAVREAIRDHKARKP